MIVHSRSQRVFAIMFGTVLITAPVAFASQLHIAHQASRCPPGHNLVHPDIVHITWRLAEEGWSLARNAQLVALRNPYTIRDGRGGALTALEVVVCCGDGTAQDVFFWHNRTFVRLASNHITGPVTSITSTRPGVFLVRFARYTPKDARCCPSGRPFPVTYRWNGRHLVASGTVPV